MKRYFLQKKIHTILLEVFLLLFSLVVLIPLFMVLLGSFKTPAEAGKFNLRLPEVWQFQNYVEVFTDAGAGNAMLNSLIITVAVVLITLFVGLPCAFIMARRNSKFTEALRSYFNLGIIVPVSILPSIYLLKFLGLMGTKTGLILIYIGFRIPWVMFLCVGFIKSIPRELDEAAVVDGCGGRFGVLKMFSRVIFPLLKPIVFTSVIIIAMGAWNEFQMPLYFLSSVKNMTLPVTVYWFYGQYYTSWNLVFADLVLTATPIILLYIFCQKYIIAGMTAGAVKG